LTCMESGLHVVDVPNGIVLKSTGQDYQRT